ncbi:hypothetical protein [Rhizobium hidalgonense]|nr:hypothetical protein [Rhizobium hidalgonense]QKK26891.1 hypothetical protein FFM81_026755 [Rhizobium hidalgonense]
MILNLAKGPFVCAVADYEAKTDDAFIKRHVDVLLSGLPADASAAC